MSTDFNDAPPTPVDAPSPSYADGDPPGGSEEINLSSIDDDEPGSSEPPAAPIGEPSGQGPTEGAPVSAPAIPAPPTAEPAAPPGEAGMGLREAMRAVWFPGKNAGVAAAPAPAAQVSPEMAALQQRFDALEARYAQPPQRQPHGEPPAPPQQPGPQGQPMSMEQIRDSSMQAAGPMPDQEMDPGAYAQWHRHYSEVKDRLTHTATTNRYDTSISEQVEREITRRMAPIQQEAMGSKALMLARDFAQPNDRKGMSDKIATAFYREWEATGGGQLNEHDLQRIAGNVRAKQAEADMDVINHYFGNDPELEKILLPYFHTKSQAIPRALPHQPAAGARPNSGERVPHITDRGAVQRFLKDAVLR